MLSSPFFLSKRRSTKETLQIYKSLIHRTQSKRNYQKRNYLYLFYLISGVSVPNSCGGATLTLMWDSRRGTPTPVSAVMAVPSG